MTIDRKAFAKSFRKFEHYMTTDILPAMREAIEHDDDVPSGYLLTVISETKETLLSILDCIDMIDDDEADDYEKLFKVISGPFIVMSCELFRRAEGNPALH